MQVFKAALRIFFKHPIYITIYLVGLGFMAIFIGMGNAEALQDEFTVERPDIAIINRDGSDLSKGLSAFLEQHGTLIEIDDSRLSMQDATAQNQAAYIMIIPQGFGDAFVASAAKRAPAPALEAVHINPISATMLNGLIDEYL
ncbi:MAG: hypothetical protein FWD43_06115, partial [Coriobacteriia bacterium]|nr:hypothetical protein [Coriobacteriia bacterium]